MVAQLSKWFTQILYGLIKKHLKSRIGLFIHVIRVLSNSQRTKWNSRLLASIVNRQSPQGTFAAERFVIATVCYSHDFSKFLHPRLHEKSIWVFASIHNFYFRSFSVRATVISSVSYLPETTVSEKNPLCALIFSFNFNPRPYVPCIPRLWIPKKRRKNFCSLLEYYGCI